MSQGQGGFPPAKAKNALNHNKLNMVTKCPTAEGKLSKLSWQIHKNNPRLTVYTGDPADESARTNNGRIQAELDMPHLFAMFGIIRKAAAEQPGFKECIECWNFIFPGGQRSKEPVNTCKIWIGKDKEGVVYISLVDAIHKDRPVIKFDFLPGAGGNWIRFNRGDGTPCPKDAASVIFAEGYARMMEMLMTNLAITEFVPYEPQQKPGGFGGGGGGYQQRGGGSGGGGGYQQRSAPAADVAGDDDLPF